MKRILLVGWDAADWKIIHPLLDRGEMPHLARLIEGGVMGDITTLEPILSPMLWNSIATGKYADQHGILGFTEVDPERKNVRPVTSTSRRTKAIWNILMQHGYRTNVIHWFGGHPAEPINGVCVSDFYTNGYQAGARTWPVIRGTVHPPELAGTLGELRLGVDEIDDQMLTLFVPRAAEVDQETDHRLAVLAKILAETVNVHSAATYAMENHPWDFMGVYYPSIDHFSHAFMNFHPPRMERVPEELFELYKDVVNGGYRFHDLMLGRVLRLAGPETTVILCSDHGFHSDHLRPLDIPDVPAGPAEQHRPLGIFVMNGPGIKQDEIVYGVSLLDVTPTILNLCGLPAAHDMPGRPILEAMTQPHPLPRIPSWDAVEGNAGMHQGEVPMEPADAEALLEQFVALGYIEKPDSDREKAVVKCERERMWNLARVYLHSARPHLALPVLEEIWDAAPDRVDYGLALASCQAQLGMAEEAQATALESVSEYPEAPAYRVVLGRIAFAARRFDEALEHYQAALATAPDEPKYAFGAGSVCLGMRRWDQAAEYFRKAIEIDPHYAEAYEALAHTELRRRDWREAASAALEAIGFEHNRPWSHLYLGIALLKLEQRERAVQAFRTSLSCHPPLRVAHFWMARALWRVSGRQNDAMEHRSRARVDREQRLEQRQRLQLLRDAATVQAGERLALRAERRRNLAAERAAKHERRAEAQANRERHQKLLAERGPLDLVIVSGLPRSGTSLMMQMLLRGGLPVKTDGERAADSDNPRGYLEWEAVKKLPADPALLYDAEGQAVKIVSALLEHLPRGHRYKILFMDRPVEEVAASHGRMIRNRGEKAPEVEPERMKLNLENHRSAILRRMRDTRGVDLLVVDYPGLVREPQPWIDRIVSFLGSTHAVQPNEMMGAIDPNLHRNRL